MANPQVEHGYTRFANSLLEALANLRIAGQEMRIVLAVGRLTYGWGKKFDAISYGQLAKMTGIPRPRVIEHVKSLVSKNILASLNNGTREPPTIWINKDFESWQPSPKKGTSPNKGTKTSPNNETKPSPNNGTHQRKERKERKKSTLPSSLRLFEPKRSFSEPSPAPAQKKPTIEQTHPRLYQVSKSFLCAQKRQHPTKIKKIEERKIRGGADTLRLLTDRDGYDLDREIIPALQWAIKDEFWTYQVLSLSSLRKVGRNGEMKIVNILASKEKQERQEPGRMSEDMLSMLDEWHEKHKHRGNGNGGNGDGSEYRNGDARMGDEFQIPDETGGDNPIGKDLGAIAGQIQRY